MPVSNSQKYRLTARPSEAATSKTLASIMARTNAGRERTAGTAAEKYNNNNNVSPKIVAVNNSNGGSSSTTSTTSSVDSGLSFTTPPQNGFGITFRSRDQRAPPPTPLAFSVTKNQPVTDFYDLTDDGEEEMQQQQESPRFVSTLSLINTKMLNPLRTTTNDDDSIGWTASTHSKSSSRNGIATDDRAEFLFPGQHQQQQKIITSTRRQVETVETTVVRRIPIQVQQQYHYEPMRYSRLSQENNTNNYSTVQDADFVPVNDSPSKFNNLSPVSSVPSSSFSRKARTASQYGMGGAQKVSSRTHSSSNNNKSMETDVKLLSQAAASPVLLSASSKYNVIQHMQPFDPVLKKNQHRKLSTDSDLAKKEEYCCFSDNEDADDGKSSNRPKQIFRSTQQLIANSASDESTDISNVPKRRMSAVINQRWPSTSSIVADRVKLFSNLSASQQALHTSANSTIASATTSGHQPRHRSTVPGEYVPPPSAFHNGTKLLQHSKARSQSIGQLPSWPPPSSSAEQAMTARIQSTKSNDYSVRRQSTAIPAEQQQQRRDVTPVKAAAAPISFVKSSNFTSSSSSVAFKDRQKTFDQSSVEPAQQPKQQPSLSERRRIIDDVPLASNHHQHHHANGGATTNRDEQRLTHNDDFVIKKHNSETNSAVVPSPPAAFVAAVRLPNIRSSEIIMKKRPTSPMLKAATSNTKASSYADFSATVPKASPTTASSSSSNTTNNDEEENIIMHSQHPQTRATVIVNGNHHHHTTTNNNTVQQQQRRDSTDSGKSTTSSTTSAASSEAADGELSPALSKPSSGNFSSSSGNSKTIVNGNSAGDHNNISDVNSRLSLLLTSLTQIKAQLATNSTNIECEQVKLQLAFKQQSQLAVILQRKSEVVEAIRHEAQRVLNTSSPNQLDWRYKNLAAKLDELDRLWASITFCLAQREKIIVALVGRVQEFDDAAESCEQTLRKYEHSLEAYDALGDTRRDSHIHSDTIKHLQDNVESMHRQVDIVREMCSALENFQNADQHGTINGHEHANSMNVDFSRARVIEAELRERHEHLQRELAQRAAVLDVASSAVKNFELECSALERYLDDRDDELDDLEANNPVGRDRTLVARQAETINDFLRALIGCEREKLQNQLPKMIQDILARGYSSGAEQLQAPVARLERQLSKLKGRAHARCEDVELMLDKLKNFHDDLQHVLSYEVDEAKKDCSMRLRRLSIVSTNSSVGADESGGGVVDVGQQQQQMQALTKFTSEVVEPLQAKVLKLRATGQQLISTASTNTSAKTLRDELDRLDTAWSALTDCVASWNVQLESSQVQCETWQDECDAVANKIVELELAVTTARAPVMDAAVLEEQLHGQQQFFERMADGARAALELLCQLTTEIFPAPTEKTQFSSRKDSSQKSSRAAYKTVDELEERLSAIDVQIETRRNILTHALPLLRRLHSERLPSFKQAVDGARRRLADVAAHANGDDAHLGTVNGDDDDDAQKTNLSHQIEAQIQPSFLALTKTIEELEELISSTNVDTNPIQRILAACHEQRDTLLQKECADAVLALQQRDSTLSAFDADCEQLLQWLGTLHGKISNDAKEEINYEELVPRVRDDLEDVRKLLEHVTVQLHDLPSSSSSSSSERETVVNEARTKYRDLLHEVETNLMVAAEQQALRAELLQVHQTLSVWLPRTEQAVQVSSSDGEEEKEQLQRDANDALNAVDAMRATFARLQELLAARQPKEGGGNDTMKMFEDFIGEDERRIRAIIDKLVVSM